MSQVNHTALNTSLTSARKVKWLRERMIGSSAETLLMNHIKEFILHDELIDVEKIRKCLHRQVCAQYGCPQFEQISTLKLRLVEQKERHWNMAATLKFVFQFSAQQLSLAHPCMFLFFWALPSVVQKNKMIPGI